MYHRHFRTSRYFLSTRDGEWKEKRYELCTWWIFFSNPIEYNSIRFNEIYDKKKKNCEYYCIFESFRLNSPIILIIIEGKGKEENFLWIKKKKEKRRLLLDIQKKRGKKKRNKEKRGKKQRNKEKRKEIRRMVWFKERKKNIFFSPKYSLLVTNRAANDLPNVTTVRTE